MKINKKKTASVLSALALSAVCACSAGCFGEDAPAKYDNLTKVQYNVSSEYAIEVSDFSLNTIDSTYSFYGHDGGDNFVIKENSLYGDTYYYIYNVATGSKSRSYTSELVNVGKNLYYAEPDTYSYYDNATYTVIDVENDYTYSCKNLTVSNGVIYSDEYTFLSDANGEVVVLEGTDLGKDILCGNESFEKVGDYFIKPISSIGYMGVGYSAFKVYDSNATYVKSIDLSSIFDMYANQTMVTSWTIGNVIYTQVFSLVPEDSTSYDIIGKISTTEDTKLKFKTYSYDIATGNVKTYDVDFVVLGENNKLSNDYAVLNAYKIGSDKYPANRQSVVIVDANCKTLVDFDDVKAGTVDVNFDFDKNAYLTDSTGVTDIYSTTTNSKIGTCQSESYFAGNAVYYVADDTLVIADLNGNALTTVKNPVRYGTNWDKSRIYYITKNLVNNKHTINFFDTEALKVVDDEAISIPTTYYDEMNNWYTIADYSLTGYYFASTKVVDTYSAKTLTFFDEDRTYYSTLTSYNVSYTFSNEDASYTLMHLVDNETNINDRTFDKYVLVTIERPEIDPSANPSI